jgi:hypothetical protein
MGERLTSIETGQAEARQQLEAADRRAGTARRERWLSIALTAIGLAIIAALVVAH